ncbi:hypothetical protein R1flu_028390 [Riccia fluitans]|uniref:Uncharacterized protein n=1 Tax=Riccia fluitans TaxID=41844 RepID=A0ABD1XLJ2_9MARC
MILMGFDPPEVQAFSRRARRRLKILQDITIEEDNIQDEDEGEDEPLDETFAQEEACEPEEDLQDQAALAEFFNMRFQPTMDTIDTDGNPSKLDEDACTPLCPSLADLMRWHHENRSDDGIMRTVGDSQAMQHVEATYDRLRDNLRAVRLGIAIDGFSPIGFSWKSYPIWPVMLINYNIPPWLATKKGHMMLSLIIPGPKKPVTMDVYLEPLVEELKLLWDGVCAFDAAAR